MRGNRVVGQVGRVGGGSIPACAGEPPCSCPRPSVPGVYPRVCGGTQVGDASHAPPHGLSPRVRGNPWARRTRWLTTRSIPACAGEPPGRHHRPRILRVYPRVCGGTSRIIHSSSSWSGLSPRVRGNPPALRFFFQCLRSIPACAGEPLRPLAVLPLPKVYPRVCGGTPKAAPPKPAPAGLSPRVRGNPPSMSARQSSLRSIPACAGEPGLRLAFLGKTEVYPRVCGGTIVEFPKADPPGGLSPRVRGNPLRSGQGSGTTGSIPACAGEPRCCRRCQSQQWVYPRVCGGTVDVARRRASRRGLSPRVRGNRHWRRKGHL